MNNQNSIRAKLLREEYVSRINMVIDYIDNNLEGELNLTMLSEVANFSRFHFHRIFSAMVGETLNDYLKRIRLERAAAKVVDNPKYTISEISIMCGFTSPAAFSRAFKEYFHMSATELRESGSKGYSKIRELKSKEGITFHNQGESIVTTADYLASHVEPNQLRRLPMNVEIKELKEMHVAYCRHTGPFGESGEAFKKVTTWAGARGLFGSPDVKVLSVYHDDPDVTEISKLRTSACVSVPEDTKVDGEIGKMTVAGGKYAVGRFEIKEPDFTSAWDTMMGKWLPESGFQPDDRLPFEVYHEHPNEDGTGQFVFDICVPVKPL